MSHMPPQSFDMVPFGEPPDSVALASPAPLKDSNIDLRVGLRKYVPTNPREQRSVSARDEPLAVLIRDVLMVKSWTTMLVEEDDQGLLAHCGRVSAYRRKPNKNEAARMDVA